MHEKEKVNFYSLDYYKGRESFWTIWNVDEQVLGGFQQWLILEVWPETKTPLYWKAN